MRFTYQTTIGVSLSVGPGIDVHVYDTLAEADSADSPLTTDSNGEIAAGSLSDVAAGTIVQFRVENYKGMAFSIAQTTT
jgi:hypothetical protein